MFLRRKQRAPRVDDNTDFKKTQVASGHAFCNYPDIQRSYCEVCISTGL